MKRLTCLLAASAIFCAAGTVNASDVNFTYQTDDLSVNVGTLCDNTDAPPPPPPHEGHRPTHRDHNAPPPHHGEAPHGPRPGHEPPPHAGFNGEGPSHHNGHHHRHERPVHDEFAGLQRQDNSEVMSENFI